MYVRGMPLMKPPYGTISAISLDKGEIVCTPVPGMQNVITSGSGIVSRSRSTLACALALLVAAGLSARHAAVGGEVEDQRAGLV